MKRIILILILILLFRSCGDDVNHNTIIKEYISDNNEYIAYYFSRDFGATTEKSYQLRIEKVGKDLNDKAGNIFISSEKFTFEWVSDNKAVITYKKSSEIYEQKTDYKDIEIEYKLKQTNQ